MRKGDTQTADITNGTNVTALYGTRKVVRHALKGLNITRLLL